jgi:hypothetical protein
MKNAPVKTLVFLLILIRTTPRIEGQRTIDSTAHPLAQPLQPGCPDPPSYALFSDDLYFITMGIVSNSNLGLLAVATVVFFALTITFSVQKPAGPADAQDSTTAPYVYKAPVAATVDPNTPVIDGPLYTAAANATRQYVPHAPRNGNPCNQKWPFHATIDENGIGDNYFLNVPCMQAGVAQALEQAGSDVTLGYKGEFDVGDRTPLTRPYFEEGLCPVNVHWHLGAEHRSEGEYDEDGVSPVNYSKRKWPRPPPIPLFGQPVTLQDPRTIVPRAGSLCHLYDEEDPKFNTPYDWQHCLNMGVGETYEVHWPHSAAGACGTTDQYQTPFYDGVFCNDGIISLDPLNTYLKIGVQAQVFVVVNDENYYYPDLLKGMLVDPELGIGTEITKYTGSTTGESRSNQMCSRYTPITWQVDRKCHMISASSFDKLCADMKAQKDDMTLDLFPHGARELVDSQFAASNHQNRYLRNVD